MASPTSSRRTSHKPHLSAADSRTGLLRLLLGLLYLSALSLLIVWEYRERLEPLSTECSLQDQKKSNLYNAPYTRLLHWASSEAAAHVVVLAIPSSLEEIHSNLCLGRAYMADVLRALATQHPAVVVIDKFYSPTTCASDPASTQSLIDAIQSMQVPVVVGESTNGLEKRTDGSCLARKVQLDFHSPNVRHGITRVNDEPERFPLRWRVLPYSSDQEHTAEPTPGKAPAVEIPTAELADSISLAGAKAYDSAFVAQPRIQQLILKDNHPYANLSTQLPRVTTTELLCSLADASTRHRWSVTCPSSTVMPNLAGRLVLIGAEVSSDEKTVLGKRIWGFDLQALYIEALLSGDYLRYMPLPVGFGLFALFVFLIEGLPTILVARRPRWKKAFLIGHAYPRRRYFWVLFCAASLITVSTAASLALHYLPPLLVFGDILFIAITRLLFFLAETAEHPFLHAHTHGKASPMSQHGSHSLDKKHPADEQSPPEPIPEPAPMPLPQGKGPTSGNNPGSEGGSAG